MIVILFMFTISLVLPLWMKGILSRFWALISIIIITLAILAVIIILKKFAKNKYLKEYWNLVVISIFILNMMVLSYSIYFNSFKILEKEIQMVSDNESIKIINNNKEIRQMICKTLTSIAEEIDYNKVIDNKSTWSIMNIISENPDRVTGLFEGNEKHDFYNENGIRIGELIQYSNKYIQIQIAMQGMGYYLGTLLFLVIIYKFNDYIFISNNYKEHKIRSKRNIYILAFLIYIFNFIDLYSDGLITMFIQNISTYGQDKEGIYGITQIFSAFKEAFLTFIIFDTINDCTANLTVMSEGRDEIINIEYNINTLEDKINDLQVEYKKLIVINKKKKYKNRANKNRKR